MLTTIAVNTLAMNSKLRISTLFYLYLCKNLGSIRVTNIVIDTYTIISAMLKVIGNLEDYGSQIRSRVTNI